MSNSKYSEIKKLGNGAFGTVYKVRENLSRAEYALKLIPLTDNSYLQTAIEREVNILMALNHKNVIRCYGFRILKEKRNDYFNIPSSLQNPNNYDVLSLRLELCECDIASKLNARSSVNHAWNRDIFKQILSGVEYIHSNSIIHRDLKPANILYKGGVAKLTDFGLAKGGVFSYRAYHTGVGTIAYMAPEVRNGKYDKTVDIYSLGIILIEFYTDNRVFEQWLKSHDKFEYDTPMPRISDHGKHLVDLMAKMTQQPKNRPNLDTINNHF